MVQAAWSPAEYAGITAWALKHGPDFFISSKNIAALPGKKILHHTFRRGLRNPGILVSSRFVGEYGEPKQFFNRSLRSVPMVLTEYNALARRT
ncbi:hypothetical protein [Sphingorhabdus sp.]|uniref:hypothetical protein n=1 Tax=Sphingorhabdus sp. TaxID=1902408 RepID=UPI00391A9051